MIGLVSCGAQKLDRPAPARDLYTSRLFQLSLAHAIATCDTVYVLSARHDLVPIDQVIAPYDRRLGNKRERLAWGQRVASSLAFKHRKSEPIAILAGLDYVVPVRTALLTLDGYHTDAGWKGWLAEIATPLAGLTMGRRLQWLTQARKAAS